MRGTKQWKRQQYCNGCCFAHFNRLTPILPGHPSVLLFVNYEQKDIRTPLARALPMNYIHVRGNPIDVDLSSVNILCNNFCNHI